MKLVWRAGEPEEDAEEDPNEKKGPAVVETEIDEETGEYKPENRPTNIMNGVLVGCTLVLITIMLGLGFKQIAVQVMVDQNYIRCAFLLLIPVQIFFTLFFAQVVVGCIAQMIGPIRQMKGNSRYYSALLPRRITGKLPHVTCQIPVYKEGLHSVIAPTVKSLKAAMATYELQGGSANIFVNDDGLQIIDEEERQARIEFYQDHSIGWTARPKHGEDGFVRKGKFKKASNMNFGLMLSNNVEEKLAMVQRDDSWTQDDEAKEYDRCLKEVVEEHGRAWADGNIRIGDYILLFDSDTRVPVDCFLDAASEMEQSPEVGIMQFSSGVMQVVHDYFENGYAQFKSSTFSPIANSTQYHFLH
jgi:membrane glycosyltransferase